jgi:hypothetical protein
MPSTQSDGVQSAVISHFKDILYLPIETSGEGEINAHSRVQMVLGEARNKARQEMERLLARSGVTLEEAREQGNSDAALSKPFLDFGNDPGLIGVAAKFVSFLATKRAGKKVSPAV